MPQYFGGFFAAATSALGGLVEVFEKGGRKVSYDLHEKGVLAAEMVRYLPERNAGVFGDVAHRNLRIAFFAYQFFRRAQYFVAGAHCLSFARFVHSQFLVCTCVLKWNAGRRIFVKSNRKIFAKKDSLRRESFEASRSLRQKIRRKRE